MKDIPKSSKKYYEWFIGSYPESWHPTTLDFFYMFIASLLARQKKERSRGWLEDNLREDCSNLSDEDIRKYGDIYRHIRDFKKVFKSQTAKLIAKDEIEKSLDEARKKYNSRNKISGIE